MTPDEMRNARQNWTERQSLINDHLRQQSGQHTREAEGLRQVQAARAASAARFAAHQQAQAEAQAAREARQQAREVQQAQVQLGRTTPVDRSTLPRLIQIRDAERAARQAEEKQQRESARQGMSDFVLHHLPRNDPKMVAYREAMINPVKPAEGA